MTGSPIGESVEAPIAGEHYWIHVTGTPEGEWDMAYRLPKEHVDALSTADHPPTPWETMVTFWEEHEVDRWVRAPKPPTSTGQAAPVHQGLEPIHDA